MIRVFTERCFRTDLNNSDMINNNESDMTNIKKLITIIFR